MAASVTTSAATSAGTRQQLDARLNVLESQRLGFWMHWQVLASYFLPRRSRWLVLANEWVHRGANLNSRIIDNTGTRSLRTLSAGLMSGLTSPDRPWFALTLPDPDLAEFSPVKLWLDEVRKRLMRIMAESNFYLGMSVLYEDLSCFGTADMIIYEDFRDVIRCFNPCVGEFYLAQNARLEVDTQFRKFTLTARQMEQQFGKDALSDSVQRLLKTGQGAQDQESVIGHCIEPNPDPGGPKANGKLPWQETYWEYGAAGDKVLMERGFHEYPCINPRWYVAANDVYGRSPAMDALGDQKQLQVEQKRKAQAIDKMVNPPLLADNALRNEPMSMLPGGVTYVVSTSTVGGAKPVYEVKPELQHMLADIQEVQGRIKETLYYDLFLMLANLPQTTERTATEILERKQEKLLMLSPMLERMFSEGLDPAVRRVAKIAARAGLFPPMPAEMRGHSVEIQYTSALALAQKSVATAGIERMASFVGSLSAGRPDAMDKFNTDEAIDEYNDLLGNSPKLINSNAAVAQMRKQRADAQNAQAGMDATMAGVTGAKTLSQTDVGSGQNALQAILGGKAA